MIEITSENFNSEVLQSDKLTLVDFWAPWCGPCKMIAPVLEELSTEFEGKVKIVKLNVDNNTEFHIKSIPTILFFKSGKVVDKIIGARPKSAFVEKINTLL